MLTELNDQQQKFLETMLKMGNQPIMTADALAQEADILEALAAKLRAGDRPAGYFFIQYDELGDIIPSQACAYITDKISVNKPTGREVYIPSAFIRSILEACVLLMERNNCRNHEQEMLDLLQAALRSPEDFGDGTSVRAKWKGWKQKAPQKRGQG